MPNISNYTLDIEKKYVQNFFRIIPDLTEAPDKRNGILDYARMWQT